MTTDHLIHLVYQHVLTIALTVLDFTLGVRPTKGQQLPRHNPVKVTVFYTLNKGEGTPALIGCITNYYLLLTNKHNHSGFSHQQVRVLYITS